VTARRTVPYAEELEELAAQMPSYDPAAPSATSIADLSATTEKRVKEVKEQAQEYKDAVAGLVKTARDSSDCLSPAHP